MPTESEVIDICAGDDVELVRLLWVDNAGVERGRVVNAANVEDVFASGANIAQAQQAFTDLDYPTEDAPLGRVGEVRLVPDPDTFRTLPYAERAAAMMCDIHRLDRTPWEIDPRSRLRGFLDEFEYRSRAAFEPEWYLVRETAAGIEPFDRSGCYTADGIQSAHDVVLEIVDDLAAQGIEMATYYPEYSPGQQEIAIEPGDGLTPADDHAFYKQTVKAVAENHDTRATFSPKPFPDHAGSGCHLHLSLWNGEENAFHDPDDESPYGISETCKRFVGGVLAHARALVALTAPSVVSYKRLQPGSWASAYTAWGLDNREAMVRIPSAQWENAAATTRLELKAADNTANPYLSLLGVLAAGRDGIERDLDPGEPLDVDPGSLSESERERRGIERLPQSLGEAIDELEADAVLSDAMGDDLHRTYVAVKRATWTDAATAVTDWDVDTYTRLY
ncbi:glutamine synthetase family protein [Haladaptatus sp. AB618]|uniref:glutamine synthetase family protein n=1 Tax=Haladaptatus sp. AB618 TaxID=2934173 RepID=UPI00209C3835|nr:glutamine synthetase family protein [Haladaptatus sp. AB618]MCO8255075.1 glutamine synthetase family protein [Haladaptatus sp. AB618]